MNDQQLLDALRILGRRAASPDPTFAERLWDDLTDPRRGRPRLSRPALLGIAALLALTLIASLVVGGGVLLDRRPVTEVPPPDTTNLRSAVLAAPDTSGRRDLVLSWREDDFALPYVVDTGRGQVAFFAQRPGPDGAGSAVTSSIAPNEYGIVVADVTAAKLHGMGEPDLADDPEGFLAGLDGAVVDVGTTEHVDIDGRPAVGATTRLLDTEFGDLAHLDAGGATTILEFRLPSYLIVTRVETTTVAVQIWGATPGHLEGWRPLAMRLVESMRLAQVPD